MSEIVAASLQIALAAVVLLLLPVGYRVAAGPTQADRLQAIDAATMLLIAAMILLALIQQNGLAVDAALALAAFAFVGTLAVARYLTQGKEF
ncbi:MAG: monovalent cation/H+ antiporter complex subunit F [Aggregatilineales bacterium]